MMTGSALVLLLSLSAAAWCVSHTWRDAPASAWFEKVKRTLLSPRFRVKALQRNLSRSMSSNPKGWLQHYSAPARMVKWGWCSFILLVEILLSSSVTDIYDAQAGIGLIL